MHIIFYFYHNLNIEPSKSDTQICSIISVLQPPSLLALFILSLVIYIIFFIITIKWIVLLCTLYLCEFDRCVC